MSILSIFPLIKLIVSNVLFHWYLKFFPNTLGPWKIHFSTREDYYDDITPRGYLIFNLRSDPFESYHTKDSYGHMAQRTSWVVAPIMELAQQHLKTLIEYPPVQKGSTFDASNLVDQVLQMQKKESGK